MLLILPVIAFSLAPLAAALVVPSQNLFNPHKLLKLDFEVLHGDSIQNASPHNRPRVAKRFDDSTLLELKNMTTYYSAVIFVGSNREECHVLVDTGSSDLWVKRNDVVCGENERAQLGLEKIIAGTKTSSTETRAEEFGTDISSNISQSDSKDLKHQSKDLKHQSKDLKHQSKDLKHQSEDLKNQSKDLKHQSKDLKHQSKDLKNQSHKLPSIDIKNIIPQTHLAKDAAVHFPKKPSIVDSGPNQNPEHIESKECSAFGSFSPEDSSTFQLNTTAPDFDVLYIDYTYAKGVWGTDTVGFSNTEVELSFGVVNDTSIEHGVLGIGPMLGESTVTNVNGDYTYQNFPAQLKASGAINKMVYSLFLDKKSQKGSVLFGAVDHKKYTGQLQTVPLVNLYEKFHMLNSVAVKLDSMYLENEAQNVVILDQPIGAILDSGTTLQAVPQNILNSLVSSMQGKYSAEEDLYEIDCAYKTTPGNLVYDFSGIKINVPVADMVFESHGKCYLGAQLYDPRDNLPSAFLGNNFLRNAYVVYDLETSSISMAQASHSDEEDIEIVTDTIPRAVKAARYSSTNLATHVNEHTSEIFKAREAHTPSRFLGTSV